MHGSQSWQFVEMLAHQFNISQKVQVFLFPFGLLALSKDCGRVSGDKNRPAKFAVERFAPLLRNAHNSSQHGLSGGYSQADDDFGINDFNLRFQPRLTRDHLPYQWFLVHPPLSPADPFEMLDGVGDINNLAEDIGLLERSVEDSSSRADKRATLPIFPVTGLFANEY